MVAMTIETDIFKKAIFDAQKLKNYGFKVNQGIFVLEKEFLSHAFRAIIKITSQGEISGDVIEVDTGESYLPLRVNHMSAGYAGMVRAAYEDILCRIKNECCVVSPFVSEQANRLTKYIADKFEQKPDFPWPKYEHYGVFRHADSGKWYALIMEIDKAKLEPEKSGSVEVVNLKIDPNKIPNLVEQKGIYPAYHMNKKSWITVTLDETVHDDLLQDLVNESYFCTTTQKARVKQKTN